MAHSRQDVYARHLISDRGYPLWTPEPDMSLPDTYIREGLKIGDVGVVVPEDGNFDVFFNICSPPDHKLHEHDGVPDNFTQIRLDGPKDISKLPGAEDAGCVISTSSVTWTRGLDPPDEDFTRCPLNYEFNLSSREGAILILPEGAERHQLRNECLFRDQAMRHAVDWYAFAQQRLGRIISNDSLYLITGFYKAQSWSLAAYQHRRGSAVREASAHFKAVRVGEGNIAASYIWETKQAMDRRVGPSDEYYRSGIPNQAVFIRGFKIAVRESILGKKKISVKADIPSIRRHHAEFSSGARFLNPTSGKSGSYSTSTADVPNGTTTTLNIDTVTGDLPAGESDDDPEDVVVDRFPQVTKVPAVPPFRYYQPIFITEGVYQYETLVPYVTVAVTHDSQWISLLDKGALNPEELSQEDRLIAGMIDSHYMTATHEGAVYWQSLATHNVDRNAKMTSIIPERRSSLSRHTVKPSRESIPRSPGLCTAPKGVPPKDPATLVRDHAGTSAGLKERRERKRDEPSNDPQPLPRKIDVDRPPVLCTSRNRHWKYISSYHGPWLQLPLDLLGSLRVANLQPAMRPSTALDSPRLLVPGKPTHPSVDPGALRDITSIRRLIDEAAEISVRASPELASATLRGANRGAWPPAQGLGFGGSENIGGGRNVDMNAMRIHRLRTLAVQKLAAAYKTDEIASSAVVMQRGGVFDDIAAHVLKHDPNNADAKYVHFFHEKIPSRQLAEFMTTQVLDELIAAHPLRLEYYRTRGIAYCFRDKYTLATKHFTYALQESRAARKKRTKHRDTTLLPETHRKNDKNKTGTTKATGQVPPATTSDSAGRSIVEGPRGKSPLVHPSVPPDPPNTFEYQLLFLRGATYLQQVLHLIESAILRLEGVSKASTELRLCHLPGSHYGGVEIGNPDGPLGKSDGPKVRAYRGVLGEETFRKDMCGYLRECIRDQEQFLAHLGILQWPPAMSTNGPTNLPRRVERAFTLFEPGRPAHHTSERVPPMSATYHPLLVESCFTILVCQLMLADFPTLLETFAHTAVLVNTLDGHPVFLPPQSMAQAEFFEVLERLAAGWKIGVHPHAAMRTTTTELAIRFTPASILPQVTLSRSSSGTAYPPPALRSSSAPSSATTKKPTAVLKTPAEITPPIFASPSTLTSPTARSTHADLAQKLDCARILLVPVAARQHARASQHSALQPATKTEKVKVTSSSPSLSDHRTYGKKPPDINIPSHGPRVEIILAWLAAVHLVELESVAGA